jgi:hypothetical protein
MFLLLKSSKLLLTNWYQPYCEHLASYSSLAANQQWAELLKNVSLKAGLQAQSYLAKIHDNLQRKQGHTHEWR